MNQNDYDVAVIGAGPIGLLLANLLGQSGIKTVVIEKREQRDVSSKAIGISPPSLKILQQLNLDQSFINNGVKVEQVFVHGRKNVLGSLSFSWLKNDYPYILSIPQNQTEILLEENLARFQCVNLLKGYEFIDKENKGEKNRIIARQLKSGQEFQARIRYLCACDGKKSKTRQLLDIPFIGDKYEDTFLMGDFADKSRLNHEAHLFFTPHGAVESFPLPGNQRRWIVETKTYMNETEPDFLINQVFQRTGFQINAADQISQSPFGVQHYLNKKYYSGSIVFCGDSAHVMSPVGGQGMNTGFADADLLAVILGDFVKKDFFCPDNLKKYEQIRKKAALAATHRAWLSMKIGTMKGRITSFFRNSLIYLLMNSFLVKYLPSHFSMLTIPYFTKERALKKI